MYDLTAEEVFDSLNGFDEIAIRKVFGATVLDLSNSDRLMFARSLVFTVKRREGLSDKDAHKATLEMTIKEVGDFFPEAPLEVDPDAPVTEVGKDEGSQN